MGGSSRARVSVVATVLVTALGVSSTVSRYENTVMKKVVTGPTVPVRRHVSESVRRVLIEYTVFPTARVTTAECRRRRRASRVGVPVAR